MLNDKILLLLKKKLFFYPKKAFYPKKKAFCDMECQGGRIDAAHHNGHAVRALSETLAFEKAIEVNFVIGTKFSFRPIFMEFFSGSGEGCKSRGDTDSCYCGPCAHHEVLLHQQKQSLESLTSIGGYTNREYNITGSIDGDDNEVMSILRWLIE